VCGIFAQSGKRRNKESSKEKERKDGKDTSRLIV